MKRKSLFLARAVVYLLALLVPPALVGAAGMRAAESARSLHACGLPVVGGDRSPAMAAAARRRHPDLAFRVGSMPALDAGDGASHAPSPSTR